MDTTQVKTNTKIATMAENDHGERVVKISFPYDLLMLERIRTLPRRAWHPNIKCWSAPIHLDTLNKLLDWGFILDENLLTFIKNVTTKKTDLIEKGVPGLRGKPYPFQNEGVAFIDNNKGRALVADDMGLGKTIEAIAWLQLHPEYRPVIIVVPASLKINWERECHKWMTGIKTVILKGTKPYTFDADIIIINYDILFYWIQELRKCSPQVLITDESHYYKSNTAKRTKAVKMIAKGIPYVIALSGTPIENRPIEIYNALTIIDPMLFPNRWYFLQRYCLPANAPILMNDFTEKKIKDVKIGDVVIGWAADGFHLRLEFRPTGATVLPGDHQLSVPKREAGCAKFQFRAIAPIRMIFLNASNAIRIARLVGFQEVFGLFLELLKTRPDRKRF